MTEHIVSRRSLLVAGVAGLAAAGFAGRAAGRGVEWSGTALGADARIVLSGVSEGRAQGIIESCRQEIVRLEQIFSLYLAGSELVRLNGDGHLVSATPELRQVVAISRQLHGSTGGLFDPTVQPLWQTLARWHAENGGKAALPQGRVDDALACVGMGRLETSGASLRLPEGGALTLNGIAQGYITDCVAGLLRRHGFDNVLIDIGEVRAIGAQPSGQPFEIAVRESGLTLAVADGALATSSPSALMLSRELGLGHILHPATGSAASHWRCMSVSHGSAAIADGLSTALVLAAPEQARSIVTRVPGSKVWMTHADGRTELVKG